jgi:acetyl-CoA carboxylase alpha subunit
LLTGKLAEHLGALRKLTTPELLEQRYQRYRNMAQFYEE